MSLKFKWLFELYFVIMLALAALKVYRLITPDAPEFLFYTILRAFDPKYHLIYGAHVMHIVLNAIHCIPLFLYIYRIPFINPNFWKFLFILRCIFELTGQTYQVNTMASFYHSNHVYLITFCTILYIPQIPSYLMCYKYAFRQDKIFR